jgi:hypothetical protein
MKKEVVPFIGLLGVFDLFLLYPKLANVIIVFVNLVEFSCVLNKLPKIQEIGIMRRPQLLITLQLHLLRIIVCI